MWSSTVVSTAKMEKAVPQPLEKKKRTNVDRNIKTEKQAGEERIKAFIQVSRQP